jgi:RTX calcium-binding nonapeptide repeat (4 copies)
MLRVWVRGIVAIAAAAVWVGVASAQASELSIRYGDLGGAYYAADPGETNAPTFTGVGTNTVTVTDPGVLLIKGMPPDCTPGLGTASCTSNFGFGGVWLALGDGNDTFVASSTGTARVEDGPGDDKIDLSAVTTTAYAEDGPGADILRGPGAHVPAGEAILSYKSRVAPVTVTLGGGADDGEAGEGDDVTGFNYLQMGSGADVVVGTNADEIIEAGAGWDQIVAGGGNDIIHDGQIVDAGAGDDYADDGGVAGSTLRMGDGNDLASAGGEGTVVFGGAGDDRISAGTATRQHIHCGSGFDTVTASPTDVVAGDCEQVTYIV